MRKLRLDMEALTVQSFATAGREGARGTVRGASIPTFDILCTDALDCTAGCSEPSYPVPLCATARGEVCPDTGSGTA